MQTASADCQGTQLGAQACLKVDHLGQTAVSSGQLMELLLQGRPISHLVVDRDDEIELFERYQSQLLDEPVVFLDPDVSSTAEQFHMARVSQWMIPDAYTRMDIRAHALAKCTTEQQKQRVESEYVEFESRGLVMLLRTLAYLVDYFRQHRFVWGVGRGSSVSSYLLFLIGVHRVDSLKYGLEITDYLREK